MKEPKLSVKPETMVKKIATALDSLDDLMGYMKSKKHDQQIINIREIFSLSCKLYNAQITYKES